VTTTPRSIWTGSQPQLRYPWRVRPATAALPMEWFQGQPGKWRLSGTNVVSKTRRGRNRTGRMFAHFLDSQSRLFFQPRSANTKGERDQGRCFALRATHPRTEVRDISHRPMNYLKLLGFKSQKIGTPLNETQLLFNRRLFYTYTAVQIFIFSLMLFILNYFMKDQPE